MVTIKKHWTLILKGLIWTIKKRVGYQAIKEGCILWSNWAGGPIKDRRDNLDPGLQPRGNFTILQSCHKNYSAISCLL